MWKFLKHYLIKSPNKRVCFWWCKMLRIYSDMIVTMWSKRKDKKRRKSDRNTFCKVPTIKEYVWLSQNLKNEKKLKCTLDIMVTIWVERCRYLTKETRICFNNFKEFNLKFFYFQLSKAIKAILGIVVQKKIISNLIT